MCHGKFQTIENECIIPITMGLFFLKEKGKNYRINYFSKLSTDISDDKEMSFVSEFLNQYHPEGIFVSDICNGLFIKLFWVLRG